MNKPILVATDGSEFSELAVTKAIHIAKTFPSTLFCISVIEINFDHYPDFLDVAPHVIEEKNKELKIHLKGIKESRAHIHRESR